jgi:hypothetical protein
MSDGGATAAPWPPGATIVKDPEDGFGGTSTDG